MIVEGGKKYSVKLIPQTCTREDAIREIVTALDHLNTVSDEIFSTVRTRINSHRTEVEILSKRVAAASEQISSLKGSQKAIRIISPAKYPCETPNPAANTIIGQMAFPTLAAKNIAEPSSSSMPLEEEEESRCQKPLRFDSAIKHPNDLLSIFHVKEPKLGDLNQLDNVADVGLGKPPQTIRNVDSFFLFNTIDNPYINYKMTERSQDRNFGTLKPTRKGEEVQAEVCPTVPDKNAEEQKPELDDFYYYPSTVEIPNIDVPDSLPDLPGIADTFDLTDEPFSLGFPSKPAPVTSLLPPPQSQTISKPTTAELRAPDFPDGRQSVPSEASSSSTRGVDSTFKPTINSPAMPPPPPPPPPQIIETLREESCKPSPSSLHQSDGGGDVRSSLMAAIREAGGSGKARLKSAKDRKYEAKKKKQDEKEQNISNELQEGGNLMADLKNTLAMRRRGISGIQDGQKRVGAVGDIMLSLASAIPTIESSVEASGGADASDNDEEDWD